MKSILIILMTICLTLSAQYNSKTLFYKKGAVVVSHPSAATVGADILRDGGNAFDALIGVTFAMAVVHPTAGNIGGGGFTVGYTKDGEAFTIDFREKAPAGARRDMYLDANGEPVDSLSRRGPLASGVPGTVAGMWKLHKKYGSMPWSRLVMPSVKLAEQGFPLTYTMARAINSRLKTIRERGWDFPDFERTFGKAEGDTTRWERGDILVLKPLAETLRRIAKEGRDGFYKGKTAQLIEDFMKKRGGLINTDDLAAYDAKFRQPIRFPYRGHEVISMPPPSSGGVAIFGILKSFEKFNPKSFPHGSAIQIQLLTEIMRQVYADRAGFLGDPDFVNVPTKKLLSPGYITRVVDQIHFGDKHRVSADVKEMKSYVLESPETTHYSIVDQFGNVVSNTTTLNGSFGSNEVVTGAGFLLNNEMDDFSAKPGSPNMFGLLGNEYNAIQPGKRMLSSMTPTIVIKNGKPVLTVGSPGGGRIITIVAQAIIRHIDYGMDMDRAVNLPRIHHQWYPDNIQYEYLGINADTHRILESWGYTLSPRSSWGDCHAIQITDDGLYVGVSSRLDGMADGH